MRIPVLFLMLVVVIAGCHKKTNQVVPLEINDIGLDIRINDVQLLHDTAWIICGGVRDVEGYILRSGDQGATWQSYQVAFPKSVYCVKFRDALHGMAGGDFLHLWTTQDGGHTWTFNWLADQVPFNGEDRPAVRDFEFAGDSLWYFCGGENLGEGVLYSTSDAGSIWNFKITGNEMRCMESTASDMIVSAGHGGIWQIAGSALNATQTNFEDDFITSSTSLENGNILFCSYNGKIYESNPQGTSLTEKMDGNALFGKRINWNDIHRAGETITVCGNDGMLAESSNGGADWTISQLTNEPHLFSIHALGNSWWTGSEGGKLYRIK